MNVPIDNHNHIIDGIRYYFNSKDKGLIRQVKSRLL